MQARKLKLMFKLDLASRSCFVHNGRLMFIKGIKPQSVSDKPAYFAGLRAKLERSRTPYFFSPNCHPMRHLRCGVNICRMASLLATSRGHCTQGISTYEMSSAAILIAHGVFPTSQRSQANDIPSGPLEKCKP